MRPGEKAPSGIFLFPVKSFWHQDKDVDKTQSYRRASSFRARLQSSENHEWNYSLTYSYVWWNYTVVFCFMIYWNGVQVGFLQEKRRSYLGYKYWTTKYMQTWRIKSVGWGWIIPMMFFLAVTKMERRQWESPSMRRLWSASPKPSHCSQNRCWTNKDN